MKPQFYSNSIRLVHKATLFFYIKCEIPPENENVFMLSPLAATNLNVKKFLDYLRYVVPAVSSDFLLTLLQKSDQILSTPQTSLHYQNYFFIYI